MILHFSHIGLTDGRTFMIPFGFGPDEAALETRAVAATTSRTECTLTPSRARARQRRIANAYGRMTGQAAAWACASCHGVRTRGPAAVTAIVNSKWAASEPSWE
jgi:hypothetical protein